MKTVVNNRINMITSVAGVLENHKDTWQDHVAFADVVTRLTEKSDQIAEQTQIAEGNSGASEAKELARQQLGLAAEEIIGAVISYASKNSLPQLAAKVGYSPSALLAGKAGAVVTRCKSIVIAASGVVADLGNYGITTAKLTAFKKKIDAFDRMKTTPREDIAERSAAKLMLGQQVRSAVAILNDELDGLMPQFKDANPNFYEAYFAARTIVDARGGQAEPDKAKVTSVPSPTPLAKAA